MTHVNIDYRVVRYHQRRASGQINALACVIYEQGQRVRPRQEDWLSEVVMGQMGENPWEKDVEKVWAVLIIVYEWKVC